MLQKATRHVAMAVKAGRGQSKAAKSWHSREQAGSKLVVPVSWQGLDQSCAIFRSSCFSRKNLEYELELQSFRYTKASGME